MSLSKEHAKQTRNLVLITGIISTLFVWTSLYDPINLPKMFALSCLSAWILGTIAVHLVATRFKSIPLGYWAIFAFGVGILLAAVFTDVHYTAFYGATQRNDGAFTYLFLAIIALGAMMSFSAESLGRLKVTMVFLGAILTLYGLLQLSGHDPFKWVLVYGPVVGTVGNPDFMSAILSVCAIATLWFLLTEKQGWRRWVAGVGLLIEMFVVRKTGSIQGLLAFGVGLSILILAKLWQRNRRFGLIGIIATSFVGILALAGFANEGPLASLLFRSSMKNRLDYWHAAIGMFKAHPLFGVGLDRFGENYGQFAPKIQAVQGQISNNAHNVFLQLLGTGGLVVIVPYLFLLGVVLLRALRAIRTSSGQAQIEILAVFSIWFSLLLVSIISIDNIGVVIWFWISGGVLYAVSTPAKDQTPTKKVSISKSSKGRQGTISPSGDYLAPIVSLVLTIVILVLMVPVWRTSSSLGNLQSNRSRLSASQYIQKLNQVSEIWPTNSQTFIYLSDLGMRIQNPELALKFAKESITKDPKTNFGLQFAAVALESEKKYGQAIPYRLKLLSLDQWNTSNMLLLVKDYLGNGERAKGQEIATKIATLYPESADAKAAAVLVKG